MLVAAHCTKFGRGIVITNIYLQTVHMRPRGFCVFFMSKSEGESHDALHGIRWAVLYTTILIVAKKVSYIGNH